MNKKINKQLIELIDRIKALPTDSRERQEMLDELIKTIEESGQLKTFSAYQNSLFNFEKIYNEAKSNTYQYILQKNNEYDSSRDNVMDWVNNNLRDNFLKNLVQQINGLQPSSREQLKLLNGLIKIIQPKLIQIGKKEFNKQGQFLIEDAIQETDINIAKSIHTYDPERIKFINWTVTIFKRNFYKLLEKHKKEGMSYVPRKEKNTTGKDLKKLKFTRIDHLDYDLLISNETNEVNNGSFDRLIEKNPQRLLEEIEKFFEQDPDDLLKKIVIKSKKGDRISLQKLLLMRLQDRTLKEISAESGISLKTLSSSINRHKGQIKRYITKYTGIEFNE